MKLIKKTQEKDTGEKDIRIPRMKKGMSPRVKWDLETGSTSGPGGTTVNKNLPQKIKDPAHHQIMDGCVAVRNNNKVKAFENHKQPGFQARGIRATELESRFTQMEIEGKVSSSHQCQRGNQTVKITGGD